MTVRDTLTGGDTAYEIRWSAADLAHALDQHPPTAEQAAVIEAPLRPLLVVAGAGSGKTETMAARVVWLVANGLVRPDEVLGLTFTRKAAAELGERLAARLGRLRAKGLWTPPQEDGAELPGGTPTVSTYHAYAGRLVREHGLRLGIEPDARLLTEAAAWQVAHDTVLAWDGPMDEVSKAESTVTAAVLDLAGELAEHLVRPEEVVAFLDEVLTTVEAVPKGSPSRLRAFPKDVRDALAALRERRAVLPIVAAYQEAKRRRDALDFADQMAVAARIARDFPEVGAIERARYRAVLLDEFQDTSQAQITLLRSLFVPAAHDPAGSDGPPVNVTAVGDPHQSIYGWRGASAATLDHFRDGFTDGAGAADVLHLSTSWRNDEAVLAAANVVAAPLVAASRVPVRELTARPGAGSGRVVAARFETVDEEAAYVASWVAAQRGRPEVSTAAVLCRKRSQFDFVVAALEQAGLPVEVVGLGGLLLRPEVADLVSLLHVVQDPSRGDRLMRLLTGPVCRLGTADLEALGAWAAERRRAQRPGLPDAQVDLARDTADEVGLVEALEDLPGHDWRGSQGQRLGSEALARLSALATVVRRVRALTGLPLAELAGEAERALGLDIETMSRVEYSRAAGRAHLDAFADVAAQFSASAEQATLGGFLDWLEAAVDEERGLDLGWIETRPDAVQVMTVHAAKGLEWDCVAVPGLVEASFPLHTGMTSKVDEGRWRHPQPSAKGWLGGLAGLPYDLRGDADALPRLRWRGLESWDDAHDAYERFVTGCADHGIAEERRLAYVALTRARHTLLVSAHVWGKQGTPRITSRFLTELRAGGAVTVAGPWAAMPPVDEPVTNPRSSVSTEVVWPPPLDLRRADQLRGPADAVLRRLEVAGAAEGDERPPAVGAEARSWQQDIEILLAEREQRARRGAEQVELPAHLSTSALVALAASTERFTAQLRRPMPQAPARSARRGTAFHAWVEQHYSRAAFVDVVDLPGSADDDLETEQAASLATMQEHFLASEWATRTPLEVETTLETVIDGIAVRGRVDAVFAGPPDEPDTPEQPDKPVGAERDTKSGPQWVVVDWKTGTPPTGRDAAVRAVQLAAYRLAWARLHGAAPEQVRAAFFYAATGETVWPALPDEAEIAAILAAVPPA